MDYTKIPLHICFDRALESFGHENPHTISIGQLIDLVASKFLNHEDAERMAQIIYHHGAESLYYNDEWDEDDEEYIEPDIDESGFDPYMGCYTGDC